MMNRFLLSVWLLFAAVAPSAAQFADQATFAGAGAGSANAQTITVANATSYANLRGVAVKYIPGATNTTAATLAVSGNSGVLSGGPISFRRPTSSGLAALAGGEIVTGQAVMIMYDGTYFVILSTPNTSLSVAASNLATSALEFGMPVNLQLNATVSANALTIAVKGNNGSDASATNPVLIPFRDVTIANGGPVVVSLQTALSFTIASGSTMGCVSGQMCRLWVVAINNAGTAALCAFNALSGRDVAPINEGGLQTSASGTSGGNSAQTYYCSTSAVSSKAVRIVGYVEVKEVTAGTWATGPTLVQLFGPGLKKPGDVVQTVSVTSASSTSVSSTAKVATSLAKSITPTSEANLVMVSAVGQLTDTTNSIASAGSATLWRGTGTTQIGNTNTVGSNGLSNAYSVPVSLLAIDLPTSTSAVQYGVYIALENGTATVGFLTGYATINVPASTGVMILNEIMASNDNSPPLSMVG